MNSVESSNNYSYVIDFLKSWRFKLHLASFEFENESCIILKMILEYGRFIWYMTPGKYWNLPFCQVQLIYRENLKSTKIYFLQTFTALNWFLTNENNYTSFCQSLKTWKRIIILWNLKYNECNFKRYIISYICDQKHKIIDIRKYPLHE